MLLGYVTDSIYVEAEPLMRHLYPNFDDMDEPEKDDKLEKIALRYQDLITEYYDELSTNVFNTPSHRLEMKTEAVIRSAYFRATRRYAQWITKKEGVPTKPGKELDIKGLEFKKTNFPKVLGKFFKQTLIEVLKGETQNAIDVKIKSFKLQILNGEIPFQEIGNPTSVKTLKKYQAGQPLAGQIFSPLIKGAPAPVKAAVAYNDLLKFWKLNKTHVTITSGDKIKWVYLKSNPYHLDALAFLDYDMPDKIKSFIEEYINYQHIFDTILSNKLENFYNDLGWTLDLNDYKKNFFKF